MKRFVLLATAVLGSCIDNSGETLQLTQAFSPTPPACTVTSSDTIFQSSGTRDVVLNSLASYGYIFSGRLVNSATAVANYPLRYGNLANVYVDVNDITIDGYNVCYEFMDFRDTTQTAGQPPPIHAPSCKELGIKEYFLAGTTTNVGAGALSIASVDLFPSSVTGVNVAFPPSPEPLTNEQIADARAAGTIVPPTLTNEQYRTQQLAADFAAYDAAVKAVLAQISGTPFMARLDTFGAEKRVVVHVQALGRTRDQRRMESNEFLFPVDLCVGCLNRGCAVDLTSICNYGQDRPGNCKQ